MAYGFTSGIDCRLETKAYATLYPITKIELATHMLWR